MDRARFESELAELLGDPHAPDRERRIAALRADCDLHPGGRALVELLEVAPDRRDPFPDPGPEYWDSFGPRVRERILREGRTAGRRRAAVAAVAAAVGLGVALWLFVSVPGTEPGPSGDGPAPGVVDGTVPFPPRLAELLDQLGPDALGPGEPPALDLVAGLEDALLLEPLGDEAAAPDEADDDGWLFPETYGLDAETRRALIEWLVKGQGRDRV